MMEQARNPSFHYHPALPCLGLFCLSSINSVLNSELTPYISFEANDFRYLMEINLIKGYVKTSEGIIIKVFISGIMMGFKFVLGLLSFPDHVIAFILLYWILLDYQMVLVFSFYQQQKEL